MKLYRKISLAFFSGIVSLYTLVMYNPKLFSYAYSRCVLFTPNKVLIVLSMIIVMMAFNFMITYLLVYLTRYAGRVIIAMTFIINALAEYFVLFYKVVIDDAMISNVFNTNYNEASGYFSVRLFLFILIIGVVPAIWVLWQPVSYGTKGKTVVSCCGSLAISLFFVLLNINQYFWFERYSDIYRGLSMPWSYLANTYRYVFKYDEITRGEILLPKGYISDTTKTIVVLVIGESDRKENFQIYGYKRNTNPLLSKQKGLVVLQARSLDTYTSAGVRCIVEPTDSGPLNEILPNYCFRSGVDVIWRTSNDSEPPVHIKEYMTNEDLKERNHSASLEFDDILFAGLKERIQQSKKNKVLVIIHTNISHGPDYCSKVPERFYKYKPMLHGVEGAESNRQALINAYDNSILYTDYLLNNMIDTLKTMKEWNSALIFVSDHGESLGENGIYMHSMPKNMAPKEQFDIPFVVWTSCQFRRIKHTHAVVNQHYVFHSVIDLLGIKSIAYRPERDIFVNPTSLP